jgi:hypothetical protein
MQEADEPVPPRDALQHLHGQLPVVGADVRVLEDRRDLVLAGRDLVVARPENSAIAVPSPAGVKNESCFSAVEPVSGWNQWA